jgi:hypothetical protein
MSGWCGGLRSVATSGRGSCTTCGQPGWSRASIESLDIQPGLTAGLDFILTGYQSVSTLIPSVLGGSAATYKVGSDTNSVCVTPTSTIAVAPAPQRVNAAVEYADTGPSTDTILRPTPLGVQQINQIRDASAPETVSYQVALQPGQYLTDMPDGSIAVIDPSIPSTSGSQPTYDPGTQAAPQAPYSNDVPDQGPIADASTYNAQDLAGLTPDDNSVDPPQTEFQYENQDALLRSADREADGQAVALFTPPWAVDASGTGVPSEMSITGPSTLSVTTHHRSAAFAYPVMASHKTLTTKPSRRGGRGYDYGLDIPHPDDLYAKVQHGSASGEGAPKIRSNLRVKWTRFIMTDPRACEAWDKAPTDLHNVVPQNPSPAQQAAGRCRDAIHYIDVALAAKVQPFITFQETSRLSPATYANAVDRLWHSAPFDKVKYWGATNEPDFQAFVKDDPPYAAKIWKAIQNKALAREQGANHSHCPNCHIVAGEFATDEQGKTTDPPGKRTSDTYVLSYMTALGKAMVHDWALHTYNDVGNDSVKMNGKSYTFIPLHLFLRNLHNKSNTQRPRVLLNEGGVDLIGGSVRTGLYNNSDRQERAAHRFRRIGNVSHQIGLVSYYEIFGDSKFDSAVVKPPDRDTTDPTNLDGKLFRPVYCVLTSRYDKKGHVGPLCSNTGGQ